MSRTFAPRFAVYLALVFLLLCVMQWAASVLFYQSIDRRALSEDHARRVAELLVVSDRLQAIDPQLTAPTMSTLHLEAAVAQAPEVQAADTSPELQEIASRIVAWEPSLADRSLRLTIQEPLNAQGTGTRDLVGSIRLSDHHWLNFRSRDMYGMWPVALRATALTLASALVFLVIGLMALHVLTRPIRRMSDAAEAIGQGRQVVIHESGTADLRKLAHSMNVMQEQIARLLQDQAKCFEAISHDLRTPLSRQKVAGELIEDPELSTLILASVSEMEDLLASLQRFLRAQHLSAEPEQIELREWLAHLTQNHGDAVTLAIDDPVHVRTFREPLSLAITALVDNAVQYGQTAQISVHRRAQHWVIEIADDGPGVEACYFDAIRDPFFRLDDARARNTTGFGLGIPIAHHLMMRFGGELTFDRSPSGGLLARLQVPEPLEITV